jgi:hypothetical protein
LNFRAELGRATLRDELEEFASIPDECGDGAQQDGNDDELGASNGWRGPTGMDKGNGTEHLAATIN